MLAYSGQTGQFGLSLAGVLGDISVGVRAAREWFC